jgi:CBS domain-containing protein
MPSIVADVMTTSVVALRNDASFKEIVSALRRYRVSACPVIDDEGHVIGMVSEADLLCKQADPQYPPGLERLRWRLSQRTKANAVSADQLMTSPAIATYPWASVSDAARQMTERKLRRFPVIDQSGRLVGIVTRSDVLSVYQRADGDIWDEVAKVILDEEFGLDPDEFEIAVSSGIVTIAGRVERFEIALHLLARIRHAEGVVGVRDRFSYPLQTTAAAIATAALGAESAAQ